MSDLIDTTEMYLRTIYELEEEGIVPLRARIAERLRQSGPTVSQTVARMERDGLLRVTGERHIELSPSGRDRAVRVMRKHRLAERLLTDVIGVEWENVHDEACRWEHVISDDVEERLVALLGDPIESPYGNPIPEAGDTSTPAGPGPSEPLPRLVAAGARRITIRRIGENLQTGPEMLAELHRNGIVPAAKVVVIEVPDGFRLTTGAGSMTIDAESADQLYAEAADSD
ncbi:metal-dependent transcriptional regulator [Granulicoccus sp. GXG6511]|uniref:metal-dependent transcriptional regulator n=1 Tax=Granulicoccus sp. GXG6511 TaxID=3381351 RepID=UPI003D7D7F2D